MCQSVWQQVPVGRLNTFYKCQVTFTQITCHCISKAGIDVYYNNGSTSVHLWVYIWIHFAFKVLFTDFKWFEMHALFGEYYFKAYSLDEKLFTAYSLDEKSFDSFRTL